MLTYSTGFPPVDALKLQNLQAVLNLLPDNTQKLIAPKDVRDSLFTVWENIAFKPTKVSTSEVEYIGIDQPLLKSKIYFGKRNVGGRDIMNDKLLKEAEYDYYIYGTRPEPALEHNTRIGFLAGTNSLYMSDGVNDILAIPYLEARQVSNVDGQKYINFEVRNQSYIFDGVSKVGGDINILSDEGKISLNGVVIPTKLENSRSDNNDKYLKFVWDAQGQRGVATWSTIGQTNIDKISSTGTVSITGSPILINGQDILFSDSEPVPSTVGGVVEGTTFTTPTPVTDILRQILYPYIKPIVTKMSFTNPFIENGDNATANNQTCNYEIKRLGTYSITSFFLTPSSLRPGSTLISPNSIPKGLTSSSVRPFFNATLNALSGFSTQGFTLTLRDPLTNNSSLSATFSIVMPWFYGASTNLSTNVTNINTMLSSLTKILRGQPSAGESVSVQLSTSGFPNNQACIYFAYPAQYRDLAEIRDQTGYNVISSYTKFTITGILSPSNFWGAGENRQYKVYAFTFGGATPINTLIPPLSNYTFKFATT